MFYETLTISAFVSLIIFNREAFFNRKSIPLMVMERLFSIDVYCRGRRISWGDLNVSTGIRRKAYDAAQEDLNAIKGVGFEKEFSSLKKINKKLIRDKVFFEERYEIHEYIEMASQFAEECEQGEFRIYVNSQPHNLIKYDIRSKKIRKIELLCFRRIAFVFSIVFLPFYLLTYVLKNISRNSRSYKNEIICEVDQPSTYNMFNELFDTYANVHFVTQKHYVKHFTREELQTHDIVVKYLSQSSVKKILRLPFEYLSFCIRNFYKASDFGWVHFNFVNAIVHGYQLTIDAENSAYLVFEHMSTVKAVRNELLRLHNNRSVYVSKNNYIVSRYFAPEFKYNYDVFCSPAPCMKLIYAMQQAETKIILSTGAYDVHKAGQRNDVLTDAADRLKRFKGKSVAITILSNGIQDETFSGELRLMRLACRLSKESNVKVFVRQKPVVPPQKYKNFFSNASSCSDSIMLTYTEYQLSDFLGVSDLFITSSSGSAADLCPAGAQFFSIDFWEDKDQFYWQTAIDGVFLKEDAAFDTIMDWVNDSPVGQRLAYEEKMQALSNVIAYKFVDFDVYKRNFHNLLTPYLPSAIAYR